MTPVLKSLEISALKRKRDGAKSRVETADKKIDVIDLKLSAGKLSLTMTRHWRNKLMAAKKERFHAQTDYREHDKNLRTALLSRAQFDRAVFAAERYERAMMPQFESVFFPGIKATLQKAVNDGMHDAVEIQLKMVDQATQEQKKEFNETFRSHLQQIDKKLAEKLALTNSLKVKLNNSLFKYFQKTPDYLPHTDFEREEYEKVKNADSEDPETGDDFIGGGEV